MASLGRKGPHFQTFSVHCAQESLTVSRAKHVFHFLSFPSPSLWESMPWMLYVPGDNLWISPKRNSEFALSYIKEKKN